MLELFHRIAEADSAVARLRVTELGLKDRVDFRNVDYDSHHAALAAHAGDETPALWDGARLHVGLAAVCAALDALAAV